MMEVEHSSETDSLAYEEWAKERLDCTNVNYVQTGCIIWHSIKKEGFPPEQTCEKYLISVEDEYTGKKFEQTDKANLDHVVSRKEIYENKRRKQASIDTKDLANKKSNLAPTNESLNKSKGAKSNKEYVEKRQKREETLRKQNQSYRKSY